MDKILNTIFKLEECIELIKKETTNTEAKIFVMQMKCMIINETAKKCGHFNKITILSERDN